MMERVRNASARKASAGLRDFFGFFGGMLPPVAPIAFVAPGFVPPSGVASTAALCESESDA